MKKKITALLILAWLPILLIAQDKIDTDRPTETQNASLLPKGVFQSELGLRKDQENNKDYSLQNPAAVFRYGILDFLELRLEAIAETERLYTKNEFNYGLQPIELGIKARVFQSKDTSFTTSLYGLVGIPQWASDDYKQDKTLYRARLLFQNKLNSKLKLNYNVGRDWNSEEGKQNWVFTISPQFQISDKWEAFIEGYDYMQKGSKPEDYIDGGFNYYISKNCKLDIDAGKGLSSVSADYFISSGISYKF